MNALIAFIERAGYPFPHHTHEYPTQHHIGNHTLIAVGTPWLYADIDFTTDYPIQAIILWDPSWLRDGTQPPPPDHPANLPDWPGLPGNEWDMLHAKIRDLGIPGETPIVGLLIDWHTAWNRPGFISTNRIAPMLNHIITNRAGRETLKRYGHKHVTVQQHLFSYGHLPNLAKDENKVKHTKPPHQRTIDIAYIGHDHTELIPLRTYYLQTLQTYSRRHKLNHIIGLKHGNTPWTPTEMEEILLDTKIVFNHSLGTGLNMRIYEAAASGAHLITDNHNIENHQITHFAQTYNTPQELTHHLDQALQNPRQTRYLTTQGTKWALQHQPLPTWENTLNTIERITQ